MIDTDKRETILADLDNTRQHEWRWERLTRKLNMASHLLVWLIRFLLLVVSSYQLAAGAQQVSVSFVIAITILAMLNIAVPSLSEGLRFRQRQLAHDINARKYDLIRTQVLAGTITMDDAVKQFKSVYGRPTENDIRKTP